MRLIVNVSHRLEYNAESRPFTVSASTRLPGKLFTPFEEIIPDILAELTFAHLYLHITFVQNPIGTFVNIFYEFTNLSPFTFCWTLKRLTIFTLILCNVYIHPRNKCSCPALYVFQGFYILLIVWSQNYTQWPSITKWTYGRKLGVRSFPRKVRHLNIIYLDVNVGYNQISRQVSAHVCKFSSQHGLAVQHSKSVGELLLDHIFWLASKHMQSHIHHLEIL